MRFDQLPYWSPERLLPVQDWTERAAVSLLPRRERPSSWSTTSSVPHSQRTATAHSVPAHPRCTRSLNNTHTHTWLERNHSIWTLLLNIQSPLTISCTDAERQSFLWSQRKRSFIALLPVKHVQSTFITADSSTGQHRHIPTDRNTHCRILMPDTVHIKNSNSCENNTAYGNNIL